MIRLVVRRPVPRGTATRAPCVVLTPMAEPRVIPRRALTRTPDRVARAALGARARVGREGRGRRGGARRRAARTRAYGGLATRTARTTPAARASMAPISSRVACSPFARAFAAVCSDAADTVRSTLGHASFGCRNAQA